MAGGWIKVYREFTSWEWYSDVNVSRVFFHLLLTVNHKETKWQGQVIGVGQRVTSLQHLADETGLSVQNVRTALNKLKSTGEITSRSTNKNTVISIVNWGKYQDEGFPDNTQDNTLDNKQATSKPQTSNKQLTTNKNEKNDKNEKNIDICPFFEDLWSIYPNKKGKSKVTKAAMAKMAEIGFEKMLNAVKAYKEDVAETDIKYIKHGSTFFNGGFEDYLGRVPQQTEDDFILQGMHIVPVFGGRDG